MPESFLSQSKEIQEEILQSVAADSGMRAQHLEKDVWIVLALKLLFSMPEPPMMVFKGGTSLSKVYGAIERFSEDVDITIDHKYLKPDVDPYELSKTKQKDLREELPLLAKKYVVESIAPYLERRLEEVVGTKVPLDIAKEGEVVIVHYPFVVERMSGEYLKEGIQLEFGGRSKVTPNESKVIVPYLLPYVPKLDFPRAEVLVLSPMRTFWEKATLLHLYCNKGVRAGQKQGLSRHWSDVAALIENDIGRAALEDRSLLEDVVITKQTMYPDNKAQYPACVEGGIKLVPEGELWVYLEKDYKVMIASGMFYRDPLPWETVIVRLEWLEKEVNMPQQ